MSTPRVRMRPWSGLMSPAVRRRSTVLPEPLPPITVTVLPRGASRSRPRSTGPAPKPFQIPSSDTAGSAWRGGPRPRIRAREPRSGS